MAPPEHCDKGPILDQLIAGQLRGEALQEKMLEALVDMAKQQERLISLADKTASNHTDIEKLFTFIREIETTIREHLLDHGPKTAHSPDSYLLSSARSWTKLKASLIGAAILAICKAGYDLIVKVVEQLEKM